MTEKPGAPRGIPKGTSSKGFTKQKVLKAILDSAGIKTTIAQRLSCTWKTAHKLVNQWPETKEAYQDEREKVLDLSETTLLKSIKNGDVSSAKWILSTQGRDRGYGEKLELTGYDGEALNFNVSFKSSQTPKKKK